MRLKWAGPLMRRWAWALLAFCSVLLVAVAGLVVALVAGDHAAGVGSCVNGVLGTRAEPTSKDNAAHIAEARVLRTFLIAEKAYVNSLAVLVSDRNRQHAEANYRQFIAQVSEFNSVLSAAVSQVNVYAAQLDADQAARDAHPLGRC